MPKINITIEYQEGEGNAPSHDDKIWPIIVEEFDYSLVAACSTLNFDNTVIEIKRG